MGFKCGIVGLPNVGKSTLFNALTASKNAEAANFPFCTIEPNVGVVNVPDISPSSIKMSKNIIEYFNPNFDNINYLTKDILNSLSMPVSLSTMDCSISASG